MANTTTPYGTKVYENGSDGMVTQEQTIQSQQQGQENAADGSQGANTVQSSPSSATSTGNPYQATVEQGFQMSELVDLAETGQMPQFQSAQAAATTVPSGDEIDPMEDYRQNRKNRNWTPTSDMFYWNEEAQSWMFKQTDGGGGGIEDPDGSDDGGNNPIGGDDIIPPVQPPAGEYNGQPGGAEITWEDAQAYAAEQGWDVSWMTPDMLERYQRYVQYGEYFGKLGFFDWLGGMNVNDPHGLLAEQYEAAIDAGLDVNGLPQITGDDIMEYNQWLNKYGGEMQLSFWEWFGGVKDNPDWWGPGGDDPTRDHPVDGPIDFEGWWGLKADEWMQRFGFGEEEARAHAERIWELAGYEGFGWLKDNPDVYFAYATSPDNDQHFYEWLVRNRDDLAGQGLDWLLAPENVGFLEGGYGKWAERLQGVMAEWINSGQIGEGDWWEVTNQHVKDYEAWWQAENAAGRPGLTFWEWADWVNEKDTLPPDYPPGDNPPPPPPPPPPDDEPPVIQPPPPPPGEDPPVEPPDPVDPNYLQNLKDALSQSQDEKLKNTLRAYRHVAGMGGMQRSGAYGTNLNSLMTSALTQMNLELNDKIFQASEAEQQRGLEWAIAKLKSADSRYSADAQMAAASAGAQAALARVNADVYMFNQGLPLDYYRLMLDWYKFFGNDMPDAPTPTIPTMPF